MIKHSSKLCVPLFLVPREIDSLSVLSSFEIMSEQICGPQVFTQSSLQYAALTRCVNITKPHS